MKPDSRPRLNGVLLSIKPPNCTSFDVIRRLKPLIGSTTKIGHTGTLDPMATGLLPLCLGEATKLVRFLSKHPKRYKALVRLGESTDTLDRTGKTTQKASVPKLTEQAVIACLESFRGQIKQIPPMFSALHHKGRRLYDLARSGLQTEREPRTVTINGLEMLAMGSDWIELDIICTSGTYIRSLANDIAKHLGTLGHLAELERTACSGWTKDEANNLSDLTRLDRNQLESYIIPIENALSHMKRIDVAQEIVDRLAMGQKIPLWELDQTGLPSPDYTETFWLRPPEGNPIAIAEWRLAGPTTEPSELVVLRIINVKSTVVKKRM